MKAYITDNTHTKNSQSITNVIANADGNLRADRNAVLNRWTKYCSDRYTYPHKPYFRTIPDQKRTNN
ncbi:hypothetical protein DPMN_099321 [Dreissena polymorpha]|uniref:Uncharacterized protein n=1 Tax=Dreissena polymorpha TaxID=45954 RepID=A0A9D4R7J3_DREPO|nr:hypothetical protein DPMN_099320 [Dreissena polymorpha]KAH3856728.1 hypothetical protein DPMN_099321 [Dreissena polymorpha]